jgi:anti-sigma B factor antagonist
MRDRIVVEETVAGRPYALPPSFVCSWTEDGLDAAWVHVAGDLTAARAPQLEDTLRELLAEVGLVVLDLRELEFIGTAGLHTIIDASLRASHADSRLVLLRAPPSIDRLFTLAEAGKAVEIGDIDPGEPPVQVLLKLARKEQLL